MSDIAISAENLSKRYFVGHRSAERYTALRDVIARSARNFARKTADFARGRQIVQGDTVEEFWALKDVSFEVKPRQVIGIIGRNGAGKSTLLKILTRITEPSAGRVRLRGRVASLLEVGTGFHPELTGHENIFLNGAILGMTKREIRKKFDEIVAFAEVDKFLDTPVKHYSSGMYVRLAFAVAAHLDPEILLIDEVLAVGDSKFQEKCLGKIKDVSSHGRTVLFVSHNMAAVRALCERAIVLRDGRKVFDGSPGGAVNSYSSGGEGPTGLEWIRPHREQSAPVWFTRISASLGGEQPSMKLSCTMQLECKEPCADSSIAIDIADSSLATIMQAIPSALRSCRPSQARCHSSMAYLGNTDCASKLTCRR
jgi:lipopolysaccharide transport system ATP-binding protein